MIKFLLSQFEDRRLLVRYIVSGCAAALVQICLLAFFVERIGFSHRLAVPIAFVCSTVVAFCLQKFWTFGHRTASGLHFQVFLYFLTFLAALLLNMLFMYVFVDLMGIWYIFAQIVTIGLVTIMTFLSNKYIVFGRKAADKGREGAKLS